MEIQRTVETAADPATVFAYLSDFTHTTEWDPGTVRTTLIQGDGGPGTTYKNISRFLGRETELTYEVLERTAEQAYRLRGDNKTVTSRDSMAFAPTPGGGTKVVYTAAFEFHGPAKLITPLLSPFLTKLGNEAEKGLREALGRL